MIYFWGCSDDCIELSGDLEEEVYGESSEVSFSNGLQAKIVYNGDWCVKVTHNVPNLDWTLHEAGTAEAIEITGRDYTDALAVPSDNIEWALLGKMVRRA